MPVRIVILAKAPLPGYAKTRLIPALGPEGAADVAAQLLRHTVKEALAARVGGVELCVTPSLNHRVWKEYDSTGLIWSEQGAGDLGARMSRVAKRVTHNGEAVILIGTDCPELNADRLRRAADVLRYRDACLIPVTDGGYALLGLKRFLPSVFQGIPWSTEGVCELTRRRIRSAGYSLKEMETLRDIDVPEDLIWYQRYMV